MGKGKVLRRKRNVMGRVKYTMIAFISALFVAFFMVPGLGFRRTKSSGFQNATKNRRAFKMENNEFTNNITKVISSVFGLFWDKCKTADSMRIKTQECMSSIGFPALSIESMETLYIAGMKEEYEKVSHFVKQNSKCEELGWVDLREFWTRYIGSFIGIYHLTKDKEYLEIADRCSKLCYNITDSFDFPQSKVNFRERIASRYGMQSKYIGLHDMTVGLPELISMHNITNDNYYKKRYLKHISFIPTNFSTPLSAFFDKRTKLSPQKVYELDGNVYNFLTDITIAYDLAHIKFLFNFLDSFLPNVTYNEQVFIYPLLLLNKQANRFGINVNTDLFKAQYDYVKQEPAFFLLDLFEYSCFLVSKLPCFKFESTSIKFWREEANISSSIMKFIFQPLAQSYDNVCVMPSGKSRRTGVMTSNLLGQWMKEAVLLQTNTKAILNENGHILALE